MTIENLMGYVSYKTEAKRSKILDNDKKKTHLSELIAQSESGYHHYKPHFLELEKAYMLVSDTKILKERNKSSLFIPKINAKAKYLITSLNEVYFSSERMADIETYINSDESIIKMWQEAIDFYSQKLNLFKIFQPLFLDAIIYGTSIAKVTWDNENPLIERIGLNELFFDTNAKHSDDISYLVHEIYLTKSEILQRQELGFYEKVELDLDNNEANGTDDYKKIKLYDIYEKDNGNWFVSTLYENELLRKDKFLKDGQPFVWGNMLPQLKILDDENFVCAYGEAVMGAVLNLQKEVNVTRNLLIDALKSHITPKLVIPKSAGVSREDIETIGKPVYKNESSQITILPQPNISSAVQNLNFLESELTEAIGITPQNNGTHTIKNETATEISIKAQEAGKRVADYIRQYNETFIEPLFDRFAILIFKYGDENLFQGFSREDVPSFRFKIQTGTGAMNKEIKRNGIQASLGLFSQLYQMYMSLGDTQGAYKILKANEKLIRELLPILGVKNVSDYLGSEQENAMAEQE